MSNVHNVFVYMYCPGHINKMDNLSSPNLCTINQLCPMYEIFSSVSCAFITEAHLKGHTLKLPH